MLFTDPEIEPGLPVNHDVWGMMSDKLIAMIEAAP